MSKKASITFRITGPDGTTTESTSDLESVILGSGSGATVKITDPKVSNLHAMLKVEKTGTVSVMDLGSEHGTSVKDQRIKDSVTLASGDELNIGSSRVKVLFGDEPATQLVKIPNGANGATHAPAPATHAAKPPPAPPRGLAGTGKSA